MSKEDSEQFEKLKWDWRSDGQTDGQTKSEKTKIPLESR